MRQITYADAIAEATLQCLDADPNVFVLGIGVDDPKGIFGTTLPAARKYGGTRVVELPASENAMTGLAVGMALSGKRPVVVHARNDFTFLAMDQMVNYAAKWRYMFGGHARVPLVVRTIIGKGWGQGATHSQDLMSTYAYFPGLHVLAPASAYDAKGMLVRSLRGRVPTVLFEHRRLYDMVGAVPAEMYEVRPGQARVVRPGTDLTIVAVSLMVPEALKSAMALAALGIQAEVLDLRSIRPLDEKAILRSTAKTRRLLCVDPGWSPFGVPAEVAAVVAASPVVHQLRAPVRRLGVADCPAPVAKTLEEAYYPDHRRIFAAALELLGVSPEPAFVWPPEVETFRGPY